MDVAHPGVRVLLDVEVDRDGQLRGCLSNDATAMGTTYEEADKEGPEHVVVQRADTKDALGSW